jgi:aquaporin Z
MQTMSQPAQIPAPASAGAVAAVRNHWPEYLMESAALGIFMISACVFGVLLEHQSSPVNQAIEDPLLRRALAGAAMGLTAIAIITSAWGQRSGAHMNPSVTLSFWTLGKIDSWDALFYVSSQFAGGILGVAVSAMLLGLPLGDAPVNYVVTQPGPRGPWVAFLAEMAISFGMMATLLAVSNSRRYHAWTPYFAGGLVALYITFEAPVSGMSMNPARSLGSAVLANDWTALWIYFVAPPAGMLPAALLYRFRYGLQAVFCAKLRHCNHQRCIFRCRYEEM